jgi:hypothetical protein
VRFGKKNNVSHHDSKQVPGATLLWEGVSGTLKFCYLRWKERGGRQKEVTGMRGVVECVRVLDTLYFLLR